LKKRRDALLMFCSEEVIDGLINVAESQYATVPALVREFMENSICGKTMFKSVWLDCSRALYLTQAKLHLQDVENGDYDKEGCERFHELMNSYTKMLRVEGHKRSKHKVVSKLSYLGVTMNLPIEWVADEGFHLYWARILSIIANNGSGTRLPWEKILCRKASLADTPSQLVLSDAVMEPIQDLRATIVGMFSKKTHTLPDILRLMKKNASKLIENHRSAVIFLHYLENHAEEELINKVNAAVLDACPSTEETRKIYVVDVQQVFPTKNT
jgi:hypothetical protein